MSGGAYRYIFEKDWDFIQLHAHEQITQAIGDAYYRGYETFAEQMREWLRLWEKDASNTYAYKGNREQFDFTPENKEVIKMWKDICPKLKALSWLVCGDIGEETFEERANI